MIPIYFDELVAVLRCCVRLRPGECSPPQMRELVVDQLRHTDYTLAEKVLALDGPQMLALSDFVLQAQTLVGMEVNAPRGDVESAATPDPVSG